MPEEYSVTMGEVVRRLDAIASQLAAITTSLAADKRHYENTFVGKELLNSKLDGVNNRIADAEKDIQDGKDEAARQRDRNRSMAIALIGIAIPALISVVGLVLSVVGAGATP